MSLDSGHDSLAALIRHLGTKIGILDTRPISIFSKCHLQNSTHIDEKQLEDRTFELPPKQCAFLVIPSSDKTVQILRNRGWSKSIVFELNAKHWEELRCKHSQFIMEANSSIQQYKYKYRPLFHPCSLLADHIDIIEETLTKSVNTSHQTLTCCDIGCGSGRDDVWLCLRDAPWMVDCVDFNHKMLSRLSRFAHNVNVSDQIQIIKSKIRGDDKIALYQSIDADESYFLYDMKQKRSCSGDSALAEHKIDDKQCYFEKAYDLVLCVRFLERSIVHNLWSVGQMIKPNGFLLMVQFLVGSEAYGHPKNKNRLLEKGELKKIFGLSKLFRIIVDDEIKAEDGRPMQAFLCQRL